MRDVAPPARLSRATRKKKEERIDAKTHRRYWVFFLLFLFSAIAYIDRVNMSVAGKPIAHEFGLSPIGAVPIPPIAVVGDGSNNGLRETSVYEGSLTSLEVVPSAA